MERIIILAIVFISIGLLAWNIIGAFKGKGGCCGQGSSGECKKKGECENKRKRGQKGAKKGPKRDQKGTDVLAQ